MNRIRIIGLALIAVFAMSEVAASVASAATEPYFSPGAAGTKFTSKSGVSLLKTSGQTIECKKDTNEGELIGTSQKEDKVTVRFTECESLALKEKCQNTATPGEIKTTELVSKLGFITTEEKEEEEVGLSLSPKTAGGLFAEFECSGIKIKVGEGKKTEEGGKEGGNSVIGKITPVDKAVTPPETFKLIFKCVGEEQEVQRFFGAVKLDVLEAKIGEGGKWEGACETSEDTILFKVKETIIA